MSRLCNLMDSYYYADYEDNWDDEIFRKRLLSKDLRSLNILDIGAGAGIVPQMNFKGIAARVCGIDPDARVLKNFNLDEGRIAYGENVPYPDQSFDLIFCDNVLEHLPEPEKVFQEISRLLRPGGLFLAKTPNKWHYMPLIARLTPHWFHEWVNRWRGREGMDVFPTKYLANAEGDLRRLAILSGLQVNRIEYIEGRPEYLRMSALTYFLGLVYERIVNSMPILARFRILLIIELQRNEK